MRCGIRLAFTLNSCLVVLLLLSSLRTDLPAATFGAVSSIFPSPSATLYSPRTTSSPNSTDAHNFEFRMLYSKSDHPFFNQSLPKSLLEQVSQGSAEASSTSINRTDEPIVWRSSPTHSQPQLYLFYAVDSRGLPLPGSQIAISLPSMQVRGVTNSSGFWGPVSLPAGSFNASVSWEGVIVNKTSNFSAPYSSGVTLAVLRCQVYYASFRTLDDAGDPLKDASVVMAGPSVTKVLKTDVLGYFNLTRVPLGNYSVIVLWEGFVVKEANIVVNSDLDQLLPCAVYKVMINVVDARGAPVSNAPVSVTPLYSDSGLTLLYKSDNYGFLQLQIPRGQYYFRVFLEKSEQNREVGHLRAAINTSGSFTITCYLYLYWIIVLDATGQAIEGARITLYYSPSDIVYTTAETNSTGGVRLLQVPAGDYLLRVEFSTQYMLTSVSSAVVRALSINSNGQITVDLPDYPPPFYTTSPFIASFAPMITLLSLLVYSLFRKRNPSAS